MDVKSTDSMLATLSGVPEATLDAITDLLAEGQSANTVRTYQAALKYWMGWYEHRYRCPLPLASTSPTALPIAHVLQFIVDRVFRSIRKGTIGKSLSGHSVALITKRRAVLAGIQGDFSGHSLRSGFVTEAGRQGTRLLKGIGDVSP